MVLFCKKNLKDLFPNICDRTRFNRTKRNLYAVIKEIQKYFSKSPMFSNDSIRIIDSMPILVYKFARAYFSKSFKDIGPYGYCASKKETYFGLKLHVLVTIDDFISDFFLTSAGIDDKLAVFELTEKPQLKIIVNKGYIDDYLKCQLKNEKNILLISLKRKNSKDHLENRLRNVLSKTRRRIENSFSQLADQFNINKVIAKSKWGLMLRITLKILAHNISFIINHILVNKETTQIKQLVFG